MAGMSLLTLLDDITALLDDIATLSKVAAQKTTGVLGDDLALNANQVAGVQAERELPVVWAVAKGSIKNKLILIPVAMAISAFIPWAIIPLLMLGGAYLCYEGCEKIVHQLMHKSGADEAMKKAEFAALCDPSIDIVALEKSKIQGAIRTDLILSAEIIVIILGTVKDSPLLTQLGVVSLVAALMTVGVYGMVALIVKLDDIGLFLLKKQAIGVLGRIRRSVGQFLLHLAPVLMRTLSVVGTAAVFLVGGGILMHGMPFGHDLVHGAEEMVKGVWGVGEVLEYLTSIFVDTVTGILVGALVLLGMTGGAKLVAAVRR